MSCFLTSSLIFMSKGICFFNRGARDRHSTRRISRQRRAPLPRHKDAKDRRSPWRASGRCPRGAPPYKSLSPTWGGRRYAAKANRESNSEDATSPRPSRRNGRRSRSFRGASALLYNCSHRAHSRGAREAHQSFHKPTYIRQKSRIFR